MAARTPSLALVADIGGTNARFALTDPASDRPQLLQQRTLPCAGFASLQHAVGHYLAQVDARPDAAGIAVACPVRGDEVRLTNRAWAFSRRELQRTLGLDALAVINDFGAVAWALTALASDDLQALDKDARPPERGPVTLIGPGTGLGVGLLAGDRRRGWLVLETEGGHASFAPQDDEERLIARWVEARFGRASTERVLSGAGLAHIDAVLGGVDDAGLRDPATIVAAALAGGDVRATRALARFCAILGAVAGDAALLHGARQVVIAGGIVPRFIPFLRSSAFHQRFLDKGRFAGHLACVPIQVVCHPHPGLLGAAVALRAGAGRELAS